MFGKWKGKFVILDNMPRYKLTSQRNIIMACAVIHNFLIEQGDPEAFVPDYQELITEDVDDAMSYGAASSSASQTFHQDSSAEMSGRRDSITEAMWADRTN